MPVDAIVLHAYVGASPPPPPELDWMRLAEEERAEAAQAPSTALTQLVLTLGVCSLIGLCMLGARCWRRRALNKFLAGLPEASEDGSFLVVAFEWGVDHHRRPP